MQFYLCQTEDGEQLAPNQAEAKSLDPKFVSHEVPTDKPGLQGYINTLLKRAQGVDPAPANIETPLAAPPQPKIANACPACNRTPAAAKAVKESTTALEVEELVWSLSNKALLKNIVAAANERLGELGGK